MVSLYHRYVLLTFVIVCFWYVLLTFVIVVQITGTEREDALKNDIVEYAQLSPEERQTIPTVKVAQAMLIKEHNKVPVFTKSTTPRQTMAYLREHCGVLLYQL